MLMVVMVLQEFTFIAKSIWRWWISSIILSKCARCSFGKSSRCCCNFSMSSCCWCCCYCLAPPTIDWNRVRKIVSANNKFVTSRHTRWTWRWPCNPNNCSHTSSFFFVALQPTCKCRICISWAYAYASTTALVESSSNITRISKCIISSNPWWSINTHKTQKHKKQSLATKLHPPPKTLNLKTVKVWECGFFTPIIVEASTTWSLKQPNF